MATSKFEKTVSSLGYKFEEQEGKKLTYRKDARFSSLALVIDLELKYINPILIPKSLMLYTDDFVELYGEYKTLIENAQFIEGMSNGNLKILDKKRRLK